MGMLFEPIGRAIARYLNQPIAGYEPLATSSAAQLKAALAPCDVLLVEGSRRISTAIKFLTQSTWSHAALCIGDGAGRDIGHDPPVLLEADLLYGVCLVPLSRYERCHTRICRPVGLSKADRDAIIEAGDFDISPYFRVVKPAIEADFDYHSLIWAQRGDLVEQPGGALAQMTDVSSQAVAGSKHVSSNGKRLPEQDYDMHVTQIGR